MSPLDTRVPGQALAAIVPSPTSPLPMNLFKAKAGDDHDRRFDLARVYVCQTLPSGDPEQTGVAP
ncbi:hypothetical protein OG462_41940 [Streptomyces sp. NBC_01077]|uniref:hypothetical protein n=1 Tax=Streptomyces sp. NBC_01077 TaxID=2903746 RepID=UPI0038708175|nr:hypothetical protein OG462_03080 [Streptomyces sp. NBC_01077]WSV43439.1 hypothetical protein OG462_41940 [Streptomyces sp. NBC_01077]